ncbi:MAG TPA: hypothetical protein VNZ44_14990, partial [Pyrinomonadaceae bacterium]|nr:hypothetical protein [Pyrinomonadaceae bacterium]
MKRTLNLALSFVVCFSGFFSPAPAARPRAQEAASVADLGRLREQYERLLAVERDPSTPAEVRRVNRAFLEERRAQLASALTERIGKLRAYQSSVAASLGADERRAVEDSIRSLVQELDALQPGNAPAADSAPAARPSRRAKRATRPGPLVEASYAAEAAEAAQPAAPKPAEADGVGSRPEAAPAEPRQAAPIEITSPDRDKTVHVGQVEVEVSVADEDVDDIMVAIYTPGSGQKPAAARTLELKRSDHGKKTFAIALEPGANRIEVSDLKRSQMLSRRTLTYEPVGDVLNSKARAAGAGGEEAVKSLVVQKLEKADANKVVICGQLQLASLNRTFALIKATPTLETLAKYFRAADPESDWKSNLREGEAFKDFLIRSQITDDCNFDSDVKRDGLQRLAAADLLKELLAGYATLKNKNSAFSSLSADTIRKQIVLLEQYLGNVEVQLSHKGKVLDQTLADRDGNYVFVIDPPETNDTDDYTISTEGDEHFTTRTFTRQAFSRTNRLRINLDIEDRPVSLLARSLIGFDQSGAAAARRDFTYFFDFYVSKSFPFKQTINPDFGERLRLWGDFRINSVPQSATATIPDFVNTGFVTGIRGLQVNQAAHVFEFLGGAEFRLTGNNALLPSFSRDTKQKFSLSFIAAGGYVTPTDPTASQPTIFKVLEGAPGLPPEAKGKEFVAFIPDDRDRFFRQY